jgi:peptide/nickel transport system ATP-binding protein
VNAPVLEVADLSVSFGRRRVPAVRGVSFSVLPGQRVGLIGQSGSGKTVTALAVMGLLPESAHVTGSIRFGGRELAGLPDAQFAPLRGDQLGMVFQEPMTALDPTMRVGRQVAEVAWLRGHGNTRTRVIQMLARVGFTDPERIADSYPHQLSGGQRQRVVVAMAVFNQPDLILCDEPTTALDVTVQAMVLALLDEVLTEAGAACLFISHDLAVVSQVCSDVLVMLEGRIVEGGPVADVFARPQHPYTQGLVATARIDLVEPGQRLPTIEDYYRFEEGRR